VTATILIRRALQLLGAIDPGETPNASEMEDARLALNALLDSWSTERLNIYTIGAALYPLVTTQAAYTIGSATGGSGGDLVAVRPIKIDRANAVLTDAATKLIRLPLEIIDAKRWAEIRSRAATASVPELLYYDHAVPQATISVYPTPTFTGTAPQLELFTWAALTAFADLVTAVYIAPGYDRALTYNLAIEIAPEFGREPSGAVIAVAREAKAAIRAMNAALYGVEPPAGPLNAVPQAGQGGA
jgi:hypothetical protein